jgi:GT2 family glycosyltransferase
MTVDPNWILEMIKLAKKNSKYIIQPKILSYYNKKVIDHIGGKYNYFGYTKPIGKGETDQGQYNSNFELDHISATMFMIDRKFFLKVGGYDEWFVSHYEDIDLYLRAKKLGGKSLYAWRSKIYHKGSVTYKRFIIPESTLFHIRKNRIRVVLKNFSGIEKYIRLFLLALTYIPLIIADSIHLNKQRSFISLKSIKAALQPQTYYSLEEM